MGTGKQNDTQSPAEACVEVDENPSRPFNIDKEIDTRGLNCPLPILRTKKGLTDMLSGQTLKVMATDPGSVRDFEAFARQTGHQLVYADTTGPEFVFFLCKR